MVSGLVTSPCDQDMIVSGDANESFSASKFSSFSNLFPLLPYLCIYSASISSFSRILTKLFPLETDPEVEGDFGDVFFAQDDLALVLAQDLYPEGKAFQL